ncbi:MAG: RnfABCDGE type electron transport complex subunit G [Lachnospiraceae bacterium]|nr:RnfABCDGE type electron transport complex subunit G [Lachnospiraceae bacterium]
MKDSIVKDALILFLITAVAGVLLAFVNEMTKDPIARQKEEAVKAACSAVFPDADEFNLTEPKADTSQWSSKYVKDQIDAVYEARKDGELCGYVINVCNKEGYGGAIRFSMGVYSDGKLGGVSILETSETPGLGLNAQEVLVPQFKDRKAESFVYVKGGAAADNEIDAISSATITTRAFVGGVNAGLDYFRMYLR